MALGVVNTESEPKQARIASFSDKMSIPTVMSQALLPIIGAYEIPEVLGVIGFSLVDEIIRRESNWNPTAKNPKSTAYGLCQFLDGTWKYVQEKWEIALDRDNPEDQLYACERLLAEEGLQHWRESFPNGVWD